MKPFFSQFGKLLFILCIVFIAQIFRRFDAFDNPQLYAEDGRVFLQQAEELGFRSLITPYNGYLLTIQRIIVLLFSLLGINYLYIPACYNLAAFLISFFIAVGLWRYANKLNLKNPIVFATSFLFLPIGSEVFMNLTNAIWMLALFPIMFLFAEGNKEKEEVRWRPKEFFKILLLIAVATTGPCSLIITPVIGLIIIIERKRLKARDLVFFGTIILGGVLQLICIKVIDPNVSRTSGAIEEGHLLNFFVGNMSELFLLSADYLNHVSSEIKMTIMLVFFTVLVGTAVFCYVKMKFQRKYVIALSGLLFFASFILVYWGQEHTVLAMRSPRYYFIPFTIFTWLIIIGLDHQLKPVHIALYLALWTLQMPFLRWALPDKNWEGEVTAYDAGLKNELSINPEGWLVRLPSTNLPYKTIDYSYFDPAIIFGETEKLIPIWNWEIKSNEFFLEAGKYNFSVISKGRPAAATYPHIVLFVNNTRIGEFFNTEHFSKSDPFNFVVETSGKLTLKLVMDNDATIDGEDRNAFIHSILIERAEK